MNKKLLSLIVIVFGIALFRVLPHPPNVSPVAAMALFGGAYFADKRMAFILPFLALILSDLIIGFHNTMIFVYVGFALTVGIGIWMQKKITANRVAASAVGATLLFFIITNFGAWMMSSGLYPMDAAGLMQAYVAGIPFLQNSLLGNLAFTAVMFGGFALLQRQFFTEEHA
ncbi:MAG: hypothetical protein KAJ92_01345 [Gammaproteobacteria bacterium]|nr:hypothetical protein [Gammaproteobacteria bacterium]MCK5262291.1 hypothetical protein [Gammaproteobacteria bacterium]